MKLYHVRSGPLRVNTYFLVNEKTNNAIVIDAGENYNLIRDTQEKYGFKIVAELLTHAHFDHAGNAKKLQDDGAKIYVSIQDAPKLKNDDNLGLDFGRRFDYFDPDYTFEDGEILEIEGIKIKAILTPGHTDGSACFIVEDKIFSGDTLFFECVGRTDFISGSREDMIKSIKKLFALGGNYTVYPGHEEFTTLSHEIDFNILKEFE